MKRTFIIVTLLALLGSCAVQKPSGQVSNKDVERIIRTLSADNMQGRGISTPGIEKAAAFIADEFKKIGLQSLNGTKDFRQAFTITQIKPATTEVIIDGNQVDDQNVLIITDRTGINWNTDPGVEIQHIEAGQSFFNRYREIIRSEKQVLVFVDEQFASGFNHIRESVMNGHLTNEVKKGAAVFLLGVHQAKSFRVNFTNKTERIALANIAGMLPGKSREKELVIFSAHYDHLGIIEPVQGDSIANGADDDASGVTAVISLAKYYKKLNNNERTLIFVAFTAEELGGIGSEYFSSQLNPDDVIAMFNIEMIGKESKFGKNSAFITGYDKSDFGQILQKNLAGTDFKFYPDPYPEQNLFYRSDNATLAALGVPAHTISTDQIDKDKLYHTVDDELETLDIKNITATIEAIGLSARSIVAGTDTPRRIPKLK
ncbi:M20/M25/M40 family metallo-hydrolase (plasmid) [Pedobacter sp. BS3]|uniref:M20/M25/M40 family metallo-hydrolase n=1 Tax=Pedobacter sp. BS3 TaxID=2567937 RepID=UPI0011EC9D06|nr:M20/M25/M40 family metallo-hydrolase [Pedobacter sp. BS3]TZF85608.1 M20/M25/M40 family metallo-hydrolase [Pedobacter sp. BS3]